MVRIALSEVHSSSLLKQPLRPNTLTTNSWAKDGILFPVMQNFFEVAAAQRNTFSPMGRALKHRTRLLKPLMRTTRFLHLAYATQPLSKSPGFLKLCHSKKACRSKPVLRVWCRLPDLNQRCAYAACLQGKSLRPLG